MATNQYLPPISAPQPELEPERNSAIDNFVLELRFKLSELKESAVQQVYNITIVKSPLNVYGGVGHIFAGKEVAYVQEELQRVLDELAVLTSSGTPIDPAVSASIGTGTNEAQTDAQAVNSTKSNSIDLNTTFSFGTTNPESHQIKLKRKRAVDASYEQERLRLNREIARIGRKLYELLPFNIRRACEKSYEYAQIRGRGLTVKLELSEAQALVTVPWEILFHTQSNAHFTISNRLNLVRVVATDVNSSYTGAGHLDGSGSSSLVSKTAASLELSSPTTSSPSSLSLTAPTPAPVTPKPLKMLLVIVASQSSDVKYLPRERQLIEQALRQTTSEALPEAGMEIKVEVLSGLVTLDRLRRHLLAHSTYQLLHIIAHGEVDAHSNPYLIFHAPTHPVTATKNLSPTTSTNKTHGHADSANTVPDEPPLPELTDAQLTPTTLVSPEDLRLVLEETPHLQLVVLNSCWSGQVSSENPIISSFGLGLVKSGIAAVVTLQTEASQETAVTFAQELYLGLAQGRTLAASMNRARRALYLDSSHNRQLLGQWFIPVHYEATTPEKEAPTWYDNLFDNPQYKLFKIANRQTFGTVFLLAYFVLATLVLSPGLGNLAAELGERLEISDFWQAPQMFTPSWWEAFWLVLLPLWGWSMVFIGLASSWTYFDNKVVRVFGDLKRKTRQERQYLFKTTLIGASLGFLTGLCIDYMTFAMVFYYIGLGDYLGTGWQELIKFCAGLVCAAATLWYARQLPRSNFSSSARLGEDNNQITFLAFTVVWLPSLMLMLLLLLAPNIFLVRPWGGVLPALVWLTILVYELKKLSVRTHTE